MKAGKADIEFFREMMERLQEEKAALSAHLRAQTTELEVLRRQNSVLVADLERIHETHRKDIEELRSSYERQMKDMQASFEARLDRMAEVNAGMSRQLSDAISAGTLARAKKYGRSAEQRRLLNNRKENNRTREEDDSDGTPPVDTLNNDQQAAPHTAAKKRASRKKEVAEGKMRFDEVIDHPMDDSARLPEGARLLPGTMWYEMVEYIPGRIVCHRYEQRLERRLKHSAGVLELIKVKMEALWNDTQSVTGSLLRKAVGYVRNQWEYLSNILKSGVVEISNNLSEQRVKPIKLSHKNVQNIGSETTAVGHAFMHSLAESARLNGLDMEAYFRDIFAKARSALTDDQRLALLPNYYPCKR